MDRAEEEGVPHWVRGAVWVVGLIVPLFVTGVGIIGWLYRDTTDGRLADIEQRLVTNETTCRTFRELAIRNGEKYDSHKSEAAEWKARIAANENRVLSLLTNANTRADPFTGTEGRALEKRLYQVERDHVNIRHALELHEKILHHHVTKESENTEHGRSSDQ